MHALTTSDLAFLLCTSSSSSSSFPPPKVPLTLRTTYGLQIILSPDGSLYISLSAQKQPQQSPLTPGSINSILHSPTTLLLPILPKPKPPQDDEHYYLLSPDYTTSTYLWSPSSQGSDEWIPTDETLLESLYSEGLDGEGSWFNAYLDWVGRAEGQMHETQKWSGPGESSDSFISIDSTSDSSFKGGFEGEFEERVIFQDEGERTLWMVEGLLLAAWLALQEGVAGVGYRPGEFGEHCKGKEGGADEEVYLLEKGAKVSLGEIVGEFLRDVRS
ncbi:hypothetical protein QBC36DRAFT_358954 [Triangularia setosa]|uniref:Uncharacterized protein n=1 Tax=Triangularia setosa TaxID=2587417 RepID=A0AAN7A5D4_9PEZI|nr:hypothetical protein QBC36DRAFT_358954 [Podospora setosa]